VIISGIARARNPSPIASTPINQRTTCWPLQDMRSLEAFVHESIILLLLPPPHLHEHGNDFIFYSAVEPDSLIAILRQYQSFLGLTRRIGHPFIAPPPPEQIRGTG